MKSKSPLFVVSGFIREGSIADSEGSIANSEGSIANSEGSIANSEGSIANSEGRSQNHQNGGHKCPGLQKGGVSGNFKDDGYMCKQLSVIRLTLNRFIIYGAVV